MDAPVAALGAVFVLVVLAENVADPRGKLGAALAVAGWLLWGVFAFEFALRMVIASSTWGFLRRNWWHLAFLVLPLLRFAQVLARLRLARIGPMGRVVSSAVRGTRTAAVTLSSRVAWLAAATAIVILAASQILYGTGAFDRYGEALHTVALATITGEPLGRDGAAGMLGAFFLQRSGEQNVDDVGPVSAPAPRRTHGR